MPPNVPQQPSSSARQHKIHFYRQIAFTFIGAAIVVLVGLLYFSLSQATVTITPALEDVQADFNVLVKSGTSETNADISARLYFTEVVVERTDEAELLEEGDPQQAAGKVTLINTSDSAQPLVATTRLLSEEGVLFRLKESTTVPANGDIEADVYADKEGKQGEIGPSRFTIPGLNQARQQEVYAESESSMTGGTKAVYKVTEEAVQSAIEEAEDRLIQQALTQLEAEEFDVNAFLPALNHVEIISEVVDPDVGSDAQQFTVKLTARVAFVAAEEEDLLQLAQAQLYSTTSLGYELSSSDEGSFTYEIQNFDPDNQTAQLRILLRGQKRISSNHPALDTADMVGKKPADLQQELQAEQGIESAQVELRPFWLRKTPRLVDHIYIQFAD